jgi:hypothetical protein
MKLHRRLKCNSVQSFCLPFLMNSISAYSEYSELSITTIGLNELKVCRNDEFSKISRIGMRSRSAVILCGRGTLSMGEGVFQEPTG